ncbi:MAG: hypothetical protein ABL995_09020 [Bryobacteraceae bacterium]
MVKRLFSTFRHAGRVLGSVARPPALGAALLLLGGLSAFGQGYHTNDVTPPATTGGKLTGGNSGKQVGSGSNSHAYLFKGNALTSDDLHPAGYYSSQATSISSDGSQQCGYGYGPAYQNHPLVWNSTNIATDLLPSGYAFGYCTGVDNGEQVGFAENQSYFITSSHAHLWHGSASSAVDLHPVGTIYPFSRAMATRSGEQVGYVSSLAYFYGEYSGYQTGTRAYKWAGSGASAMDLHPAGFDGSQALATNGIKQGGWGYSAADLASHLHALLWSGDAGSVVDLHPAGYADSRINALSDTIQVGEAWVGVPYAVGSVRHALAWKGTADSVIDLNQYLPAGYTHGVATGIDSEGNIAGYAFKTINPYVGMYTQADAIAVVFAPGPAPATQLSTITLDSTNVNPGASVTATVTLGSAAPAGGVTVNFLSTNPNIAVAPAAVTIAEGSTSATASFQALGTALTVPTATRIYAGDGSVSKYTTLTVSPVVNISGINVNPVEGGFGTTGSVLLTIPAQTGGATVTLTSGDSNLLTVPASVTVPAGYTAVSFTATTNGVSAATVVPVTATFNGTSVTANVTLSAAPVVTVSSLLVQDLVGGNALIGTVILNTFPRNVGGATIQMSSSNPAVQVPATIVVPQFASSVTFTATTSTVPAITPVNITASFNGSSATGTTNLNPVPTVTISSADWDPVTLLFKVQADTSYANSILTYGLDGGPAVGALQLELGIWKAAILMETAPKTVTIWNSNGGSATATVVIKAKSGGGATGGGATGGGGGGGGGTKTSSSYKLAISTAGKGTVTTNPSGSSYAAGTVVTLTATPAAGSPWVGWTGDCSGKATTCTLTMNASKKVTALFK